MTETRDASPPPRPDAGRWTRIALVVVVAALVVAFFAFDLGRHLSLDALKRNRADLEAWRAAHPVTARANEWISLTARG